MSKEWEYAYHLMERIFFASTNPIVTTWYYPRSHLVRRHLNRKRESTKWNFDAMALVAMAMYADFVKSGFGELERTISIRNSFIIILINRPHDLLWSYTSGRWLNGPGGAGIRAVLWRTRSLWILILRS